MKSIKLFTLAILTLFFYACEKQCDKPCDHNSTTVTTTNNGKIPSPLAISFPEDFESGTKTSYTAADVTLKTGIWNLNDALIGNSASDVKNGTQSVRVRNSGKLTMKFDTPNGAATVTVKHAKYGSDANGTWQLWYSTDGGVNYTQTGATITTSATTLQTQTFTVNVAGTIRFDIRKTDGGTNRINFDDFSVTDYTASNPLPGLTGMAPASATAGSSAVTLTVTGANFIAASVVNWNGAALTTTFVNATTLTATVPAANLVNAGSASVTVVSPAPGGGTSGAATFTINPVVVSTAKKFLFDATHAETAGNADWVIDEDGSPQRIPTPAQSTITSSTSETYWTGALSSWGIALVKQGQSVETLPSGAAITYGNASNTQDLSHYDVFVVDEPNTRFTAAEKVALLNFVNNGGGLFMISDHTVSDRNNDGWDSPDIWNDLMSNNTIQTNPFGFTIDLANFSQVTSNVLTNSTSNTILHGSQGAVSQLEFNNGTTVTINPAVNATVKGLIWKSSVTQGNSNIMSASSTYGNGRVFFVGDSSPMDDGTGASGNSLFVSWTKYSHRNLFMNASLWLAKLQ